jgi:surface antigen
VRIGVVAYPRESRVTLKFIFSGGFLAVVDQPRPPRDGLYDLFAGIAFDSLISASRSRSVPVAEPVPGVPLAPPVETPTHYTSRRELRAAQSSTQVEPAKPPTKRELKAMQSRGREPLPFVRPIDSAYPVERVLVVVRPSAKKKRKKGSGLLTIVAVAGLFASVALPAYAFAPLVDSDTASVETAEGEAALLVSEKAAIASPTRGDYTATTSAQLRRQTATNLMAANYANYMSSGARDLGDDYPWFSELSNNQGGGLSPLNYFYRECVDFAAWRLNRDAGSFGEPFLYDWSFLTPTGGNASQWKYAWIKKGWPTSTTPIAGSIAWFPYNHVAYVKSVNADGTVTIEEYNGSGTHVYGIRDIQPTAAPLYLYPPPR